MREDFEHWWDKEGQYSELCGKELCLIAWSNGEYKAEKQLTETDLILILEALNDSYDDTNRGFLEYEAMWKNSPTRKLKIDGMKRMVDKHTHAIEIVEEMLRKAEQQ